MKESSEDRQAPERTLAFTIPALPSARRTGGRIDRAKAPTPKLVGYYTKGKTPNWTRAREYDAWKDHVRAHAPPELRALRPHDEATRVRLDVVCYFAHGTHPDPENVRKGVVDALFPFGDKWVYGQHDHPRYDAGQPRAQVTVTVFGASVPTSPPETNQVAAGAPPGAIAELAARDGSGVAAPRQPSPARRGDTPKAQRAKRGATGSTTKGARKTNRADTLPGARRTFWDIVKAAFAEAAGPPQKRPRRAGAKTSGTKPSGTKRGNSTKRPSTRPESTRPKSKRRG